MAGRPVPVELFDDDPTWSALDELARTPPSADRPAPRSDDRSQDPHVWTCQVPDGGGSDCSVAPARLPGLVFVEARARAR